jgi:hypothetical protein
VQQTTVRTPTINTCIHPSMKHSSAHTIMHSFPLGLKIFDRDDYSVILATGVQQIMRSVQDIDDKKQFIIITKSTTGVYVVCMFFCVYVCMYVCMVCMLACMYVSI